MIADNGSLKPGSVSVTIEVDAPPERAFAALTDPAAVRLWFGELAPALRAGGAARLDFGDGDYFDLDGIWLDAPARLGYSWRFLGTSPANSISWQVDPRPDKAGSRVTVTDSESERSPTDCDALREGWIDFTGRLERFLSTGEPARYDWRRDIDGSIPIALTPAKAWERLLDAGIAARWLPFQARGAGPAAELRVLDGGDHGVLHVEELSTRAPRELRLTLGNFRWAQPTRCRIALLPRAHGSLLVVSHSGWEDIDRSQQECRNQRKRFCGLWIEALHRARSLTGEKAA